MQGFNYAMCFDMNRGYYHFLLDDFAQRLCAIILLWGKYYYNRLSQGLKTSSDIFQSRMDIIFQLFEDVMVYVDNIILYTKGSFKHHCKRIQAVLEEIRAHNLHVHIKKTYLATPSIDCLGYHLHKKGISPQAGKIAPILAFKPPSNQKQVRSFSSFVNYYKKLWHHRSHDMAPINDLTQKGAKFVWGPKQQQAFNKIKRTIARRVLLCFPDFSKPFDIYADALDE
eukprot:8481700-Ditylum_brightwellii.AAC.1